jgi:hypothetical protein
MSGINQGGSAVSVSRQIFDAFTAEQGIFSPL